MAFQYIGKFETVEDDRDTVEVYVSGHQVNLETDSYNDNISMYLSLDETKQLISYLERAIKVIIHEELEKP